jgi:hypothetical protein
MVVTAQLMPGGIINYDDIFEKRVPLVMNMGAEDDWYDAYTLNDFMQKTPVRTNEVARSDGKTVLREFAEVRDKASIHDMLLAAGLLKVQGDKAALQRVTKSTGVAGELLQFPASSVQQPVVQQLAVQQPTSPAPLQFVNATDSLRTLPADLVTLPASPSSVTPSPIVDFSILGLDFISSEPQEPNIRVTFEFAHGEYESFYHAVIQADAVVYLVFDTRWRYGRFTPKSKDLTTICIDGSEMKGVFWTAASFRLGVMELTPFIISIEEPETQEERIADF